MGPVALAEDAARLDGGIMRGDGSLEGQALNGIAGTHGGLECERLREPAQAAAGLELQLPCQALMWRVAGLSVPLLLPELPPHSGLLPSEPGRYYQPRLSHPLRPRRAGQGCPSAPHTLGQQTPGIYNCVSARLTHRHEQLLCQASEHTSPPLGPIGSVSFAWKPLVKWFPGQMLMA